MFWRVVPCLQNSVKSLPLSVQLRARLRAQGTLEFKDLLIRNSCSFHGLKYLTTNPEAPTVFRRSFKTIVVHQVVGPLPLEVSLQGHQCRAHTDLIGMTLIPFHLLQQCQDLWPLTSTFHRSDGSPIGGHVGPMVVDLQVRQELQGQLPGTAHATYSNGIQWKPSFSCSLIFGCQFVKENKRKKKSDVSQVSLHRQGVDFCSSWQCFRRKTPYF